MRTAFRLGAAFAGGLLAAAAMPPYGVFPVLLPAFVGLLWLLTTARTRWGGFGAAWAFAFGFHLIGLLWVGEAFEVEAERFGWLRPFAVSLLPAGLALFAGVAGALFVRLRSGRAAADVLLFAGLFTGTEWLRGHILTGFPWNLPAQAWDHALPVAQAVAWIGPYGLSFLTVLAAAAPFALYRTPRRQGASGLLLLSLPLMIAAVAGGVRLANAPAIQPGVEGITLRLVQPNVAQREKWLPDRRWAIFERHLALSRDAAAAGVTHIIWPEAATPFLFAESPDALRLAAENVPAGGALISGTPRRMLERSTVSPPHSNALIAVTDTGAVSAVYDKQHLVPFGEYVPLKKWLPLEQLAQGKGDFTPGPGPVSLRLPGLPPFSPLICYEAIFPGEVVDSADRPAWLLNVTNDAWFGTSAGPHQHLAIARLRSIEEGLPLVRVANTGISALIDPYGRIVAKIPLITSGYIDVSLPHALSIPIYASVGDIPILLLIMVKIAVFAARPRCRGRQPQI